MSPEHDRPRRTGEHPAPSGDFIDRPWEEEDASGATGAASSDTTASSTGERRSRAGSPNMLPGRQVRRSGAERLLVRLIATCGIVAIGVAIAAIMVSSKSSGWVVGLVVSIVSVVLAAILWSSRML